ASALFGLFVTAGAQTRATDYTQWRGQNRDGSASGFVEPKAWPEKLTLKWKIEIGEGYATPILVGNRVYEHTRRDGAEVLMALEADTGKTIWETKYAAPYKMNPATARHGQGPTPRPLHCSGSAPGARRSRTTTSRQSSIATPSSSQGRTEV